MPSKKLQATARFIIDEVLAPVPHRHYVLAMPKMLRVYFQRDRSRLKQLFTLARESITEYLRIATGCIGGTPGMVLTLQTFGEYLHFNPHIHALVADGLFAEPSSKPSQIAKTKPNACGALAYFFRTHAANIT